MGKKKKTPAPAPVQPVVAAQLPSTPAATPVAAVTPVAPVVPDSIMPAASTPAAAGAATAPITPGGSPTNFRPTENVFTSALGIVGKSRGLVTSTYHPGRMDHGSMYTAKQTQRDLPVTPGGNVRQKKAARRTVSNA